ncbi:MAG: glycosyltransferase [Nitrososphaeria archaeon]|jgi:glycosyltransferase involved in cell wall biosynthesis
MLPQVAVVHPSLNFRGGAERVAIAIIQALKEEGATVSLVTIDRTDWGELNKYFGIKTQVDREYFIDPSLNLSKLSINPFNAGSLVIKFMWLVRSLKSDIVVNAYGDLDILNNLADVVYEGMPYSLAREYRGIMPKIMKKWYTQFAYNIMNILVRQVMRKDPVFIANSNFTKDILVKSYRRKSRICVVYPPCNTGEINLSDKKKDIVLNMSRFSPGKSLEAIPYIARETERWKYVITGSTNEGSDNVVANLRLKAKELGVADRLEIYCNTPRQVLLRLMSEAKVYLSTMKNEMFGISIVEAMSSGCVPIVHRSGGPWKDVLEERQGYCGYSYSGYNEVAGFVRLLSDDQLFSTMSARSRERAQSFGPGVFRERFIQEFKKVLEAKYHANMKSSTK